MRQIAVRRATVADAPAIADVHVASWRVAYVRILPAALRNYRTAEEREAQWRDVLGDESRRGPMWVADDGGRVTGFVNAGETRDPDAAPGTGELFAIYVHPDYMGISLGRALFAAAVEWLTPRFERATLWVLRDNRRARRFYEAAGWSVDGAERPIDLRGYEAIELRYRVELASDDR